MNAALTFAAVLVVGYVGLATFLWHNQERIVFQAPRKPDGPGDEGIRQLSFGAPDGTVLKAYVVGDPRPDRPIVLAFHGNAVVARWMIPWTVNAAKRLDACVVLAEYRGYDGMPGKPNYVAAGLDARATLDAASAQLGIAKGQFVIYGHSLGSAIAAELAADAGPRALVLESPFTSARDMVARWPIVSFRIGWSLVSRVHYDTLERVRALDVPVHVVHGERDMVVPPRMGRTIFEAARRPGELLMLRAAGHNDVPDVGGDEYWRWLADAIGA